jgi:hypothetical protein
MSEKPRLYAPAKSNLGLVSNSKSLFGEINGLTRVVELAVADSIAHTDPNSVSA